MAGSTTAAATRRGRNRRQIDPLIVLTLEPHDPPGPHAPRLPADHATERRMVSAGDNPHRLHSEVAFARLCGVAPIPVSSGRTYRHRLHRGGDRLANNPLWRIAQGPHALPPAHQGLRRPPHQRR